MDGGKEQSDERERVHSLYSAEIYKLKHDNEKFMHQLKAMNAQLDSTLNRAKFKPHSVAKVEKTTLISITVTRKKRSRTRSSTEATRCPFKGS
jgi:hypothetical protein